MDIRQLRYFVTVAEEGQITAAAKKLHMEQPPLSRQMKQIEDELGVVLFDRTGRRLRLTPAGERLRERAIRLLGQLEETVAEVREHGDGVRGVLSVGAVVSCTSLLPGPLGRFRERHPQVSFKLSEGDHHLLGERLDRREIELAVARLPFEAPGGPDRYAVKPLPSDPIVALLPAGRIGSGRDGSDEREERAAGQMAQGDEGGAFGHRAGRGPVPSNLTLAELAAFPLVSLKTDRTVVMHETIMRAFADAGLHPRVLCECASVAIALTLVAHGFGAALLPKSVMSTFPLQGIDCFELKDANLMSEVGLVWLKDRYLTRAARSFIELFDTADGQSAGSGLS
ncbi:LysR family transcriptional regulator [Cohnella sp. 56]|uniref:LysR family transcriptional regulator n=1 Tax=Cohnella sp. 56 TaxID=3113722 RepID=UPI0030E7F8E5